MLGDNDTDSKDFSPSKANADTFTTTVKFSVCETRYDQIMIRS